MFSKNEITIINRLKLMSRRYTGVYCVGRQGFSDSNSMVFQVVFYKSKMKFWFHEKYNILFKNAVKPYLDKWIKIGTLHLY